MPEVRIPIPSVSIIDEGTKHVAREWRWFFHDIFIRSGGLGDITGLFTTDIGSSVQAWDAELDAIAALSPTDGNFIVGDGSNWMAESGNTARASLGVGTGDSPTFAGLTLSTTPLPVASGGTGAATFTDGGVLLGSGTDAITAMAVLADGEIIVGNGTTDPVAESGATARTSLGAQADLDVPSQAEAEAGTATTERVWTAQRVAQAIGAIESKGSVILNGNFDIWQRGTAFTSVATGDYTADRWVWGESGAGVVTIRKGTATPDPVDGLSDAYIEVDVTTADGSLADSDFYVINQNVEGFDAMRFGLGSAAATQITLSFWVRSSKAGIHCVSFRNSALNRSYVVEYTIASANTWEFFTVTLTSDTAGTWLTDNGIGLRIGWALASGANFQGTADTWNAANDIATSNQVNVMDNAANFFRLSRVDLKVGSVATSFERRLFAHELAACQRYTWVPEIGANDMFGLGQAANASTARVLVDFPITMRADPALTVSAAGDFSLTQADNTSEAVTSLSQSTVNVNSALLLVGVGGNLVAGNVTRLFDDGGGNAKLIFDAEL
jgi:hypothetical protein